MTAASRSPTALRGLLHPAAGPILRVQIHPPGGPKRGGLVVIDTGASMSAIDRGIARQLNLPSPRAATFRAITETEGEHLSAVRAAGLCFPPDRRVFSLEFIEVPALADRLEGFEICALLGWDFLQKCKLSCDGPAGSFSLDLPITRRTRRR